MNTLNIGAIGITVSGNKSRVGTSYAEMFGKEFQKKLETLASGMVQHGFLISEGHVGVTPITKAEIQECKINRKGFLAAIKDLTFTLQTGDMDSPEVKLSGEIVSAVYAKAWEGEMTYTGVYGNLRTIAVPMANAARIAKGLSPIAEIPIDDLGSLTAEERVLLCVQENTQKGIGTVPLSDQDKVKGAYQMYTLLMSQNDIRKAYKHGTGQKLFECCEVNKLCPELNLVERLQDPKNQVLWDSIKADKLRQFKKAIVNAPSKATKDEAKAVLVAYLADTKASPSPVRVKQEHVKALLQSSVVIIREVGNALEQGNLQILAKYLVRAEAINAAVSAVLETAPVEAPEPEAEITQKAAKKR